MSETKLGYVLTTMVIISVIVAVAIISVVGIYKVRADVPFTHEQVMACIDQGRTWVEGMCI